MPTMPCRRCSECKNASHHWTPDPMDPDDSEYQPGDYACKHCDQRGNCCPCCEEQGCAACDGEGVIPLGDWIQSAAEEIHDQLDDIEGEAGQVAQVAQDIGAGFLVWRQQVMEIIRRHCDVPAITWHPVTKKLPEDDRDVLLVVPGITCGTCWPGHYDEGTWRWDGGGEINRPVTHWAEMPEGPRQ